RERVAERGQMTVERGDGFFGDGRRRSVHGDYPDGFVFVVIARLVKTVSDDAAPGRQTLLMVMSAVGGAERGFGHVNNLRQCDALGLRPQAGDDLIVLRAAVADQEFILDEERPGDALAVE